VAFNELSMNVLQALSVDVNDPEIKAVVEKAPQVGKVLATGAWPHARGVAAGRSGSRIVAVQG
jgi:hypothetical protein